MFFDEVLEQIGEGIFQKFALAVCGLSVLAEEIASTCVPFAMILVSCDLKITLVQILGLNVILTLSKLISAYWLGAVSDMSGRKLVLSTTSIITFVGCFVASFSQCVVMLFISLFLLGIGLGGNHSATRIFIVEITPKSLRGSRFIILEIFSAVGYASAIGMSKLLVPHFGSDLLGNNVRLNTWRILFGLSGSLSIFSSCLMSVFPASPRWLLGKKQDEEAVDILRKIFAVNKVKHEESFPNICLDPITYVDTRMDPHSYQCNNPFARSLRSLRIYTKHLFTKNFIRTTFTCIIISFFLFDGLVMMNIWLSLTLYSGDMTTCVLNGACPLAVDFLSPLCNQALMEDLFKMNAYLSICSFVLLLVLGVADKIPRKFILMGFSFAAALSAFGLVFVPHDIIKITFAFGLLSFMFIAEVTFRIIILECFPTVLRCTAYGFITIFSKLMLILLMVFLRAPCIWAFVSFGSAFTLVGILATLLPNLNKEPMRE